MALCATTALAGAVSRLCVRGARGRFGGARAGTWCCVPPSSPFPPRLFRAACGGPSRPGVPYPRSLVRHSMRSVRSACSVRLPFWWSPRVLFVCVRSRSRGVRSPLGGVVRASRVVPALGAGRAVPCGPCPSACPAPVPCSVWRALGGGGLVPVPPYLAWGCGGGGRASPGGCLRPLRGALWVLRSSSPDCPATRWAVGVCGVGVRLWGPSSVLAGGERGVDLVSWRRPAGFP